MRRYKEVIQWLIILILTFVSFLCFTDISFLAATQRSSTRNMSFLGTSGYPCFAFCTPKINILYQAFRLRLMLYKLTPAISSTIIIRCCISLLNRWTASVSDALWQHHKSLLFIDILYTCDAVRLKPLILFSFGNI